MSFQFGRLITSQRRSSPNVATLDDLVSISNNYKSDEEQSHSETFPSEYDQVADILRDQPRKWRGTIWYRITSIEEKEGRLENNTMISASMYHHNRLVDIPGV